jgi:carbon storage regulator
MLILSRKIDESIILNGQIEVVVVDVDKNGNVKLGIKAPKDVSIFRKEIYEEIQKSNKEAVQQNVASAKLNLVKDMFDNKK